MKVYVSGEAYSCDYPEIFRRIAINEVVGITREKDKKDYAVVGFEHRYIVNRIDEVFLFSDDGKLIYRGDKIWQPDYDAAAWQGIERFVL